MNHADVRNSRLRVDLEGRGQLGGDSKYEHELGVEGRKAKLTLEGYPWVASGVCETREMVTNRRAAHAVARRRRRRR